MNKSIFTGHVGRDAVIRENNGSKAIGFNVAVNNSYKNAEGVKVDNTMWVSCTIWRKGGQSLEIAKYLKSGTQVLVEGELSVEVYQNKDRQFVPDIRLRINNLELLSKKEQSGAGNQTAATPATASNTAAPAQDEPDDLPF